MGNPDAEDFDTPVNHFLQNAGRLVIGGLDCHNINGATQFHEIHRQLRKQLAGRDKFGEEVLREDQDVLMIRLL
jgi:hypothetical protein